MREKNTAVRRQHGIKILGYTTKNFWLLLIPLIRGLAALRFDFYSWLEGAWLDVLVLTAMLGFAVARWYCTSFEAREGGITINSGVVLKKRFFVTYDKITAATAEHTIWLRPFRAANLYLDTDTGLMKKADITLTVRSRDCEDIFALLPNERTAAVSYRPSKINLAVFSVFFSSTISGVVFISTLLIQSGKLVGKELEEYFIESFNHAAGKLALGLPPLAVGVSALIIFGWLVSFIGNTLRHFDFRIVRRGGGIHIETGMLNLRRYYISVRKINYADLRQTLSAKLFRICSVHVSCSGYGKAKNEIPVFVPITTGKEAFSTLKLLLPMYDFPKVTVLPPASVIFSYLWLPILMIFGFLLIAFAAVVIFPGLSAIILFAAVMAEIPSVWLLLAKLAAFFTTGIGADGDTLALKYCFGYAFHTVFVHRERIAKVVFTRSIFQIVPKTCTVRIYTNLEHTKCHIVRNLPLTEAQRLLSG